LIESNFRVRISEICMINHTPKERGATEFGSEWSDALLCITPKPCRASRRENRKKLDKVFLRAKVWEVMVEKNIKIRDFFEQNGHWNKIGDGSSAYRDIPFL
jgi:hypothetical protein